LPQHFFGFPGPTILDILTESILIEPMRFPFVSGVLSFCGIVNASNQFPIDASILPITSNHSQIWAHPTSRDHYIEVRSCNLCPGQDLWSGYFHSVSEGTAIFFVYARAFEKPEDSPLAIWSNGGPGTSPLALAFSRASGCVLEEDYRGMRLTFDPNVRPRPWNRKMNVIFIEQPLGTGFSKGNAKGEEDTRVGAEYIYNFLQVVLSRHPHIPDVSFHSLSFGGHFVTEWSSVVISENAKVKAGESNNLHVPLKSVTMGNSWFGSDIEYLSRFDALCKPNLYLPDRMPLLRPSECKRAAAHREMCAAHLKRCRNDRSDSCAGAHLWCLRSISFFYEQTGRNFYHISDFMTAGAGYDTYPEMVKFLNLRAVQISLGVIGLEDALPRKWEFYNERVSDLHTLAGDHVRRTDVLIPGMIEAGVDVLIYEGTSDFICGLEAVRAVVEAQDLIPGEVEKQMKVWKSGLGRYVCSGKKSKARFCYLEVDGEGHGLPIEYDGWPDILERWVLGGSVA
jgi:carboxypeptidase C (cathepsin A)